MLDPIWTRPADNSGLSLSTPPPSPGSFFLLVHPCEIKPCVTFQLRSQIVDRLQPRVWNESRVPPSKLRRCACMFHGLFRFLCFSILYISGLDYLIHSARVSNDITYNWAYIWPITGWRWNPNMVLVICRWPSCGSSGQQEHTQRCERGGGVELLGL